jgi:hypothetical protein
MTSAASSLYHGPQDNLLFDPENMDPGGGFTVPGPNVPLGEQKGGGLLPPPALNQSPPLQLPTMDPLIQEANAVLSAPPPSQPVIVNLEDTPLTSTPPPKPSTHWTIFVLAVLFITLSLSILIYFLDRPRSAYASGSIGSTGSPYDLGGSAAGFGGAPVV